ncbi:MAG: hypothetical protein M1825_002396 [Sarcosagium campestre]|nr:MAG: hypothetical protein M1825_002396 [Sarcosagium campestre]
MSSFKPTNHLASKDTTSFNEAGSATSKGSSIVTVPEEPWTRILSHPCTFSGQDFDKAMWNLILNPNLNSPSLFRADILYDSDHDSDHDNDREGQSDESHDDVQTGPLPMQVQGFETCRVVVRRLVPRNPARDAAMLQTCRILRASTEQDSTKQNPAPEDDADHLVIYQPHVQTFSQMPFYHPPVRAIAFLHQRDQDSSSSGDPNATLSLHIITPFLSSHGDVSISFQNDGHTIRVLGHLLETTYRHGEGMAAGYVKRVHHDRIVPQPQYQDAYTRLKQRHAKRLLARWVESTDPNKHVFEDLGIAAFLTEVWSDMYSHEDIFPGFVDIGCGNGVLVDILIREGWRGWGFDARRRKTWATFDVDVQQNLKETVLVPRILQQTRPDTNSEKGNTQMSIHDGVFLPGTFIISNHADELTGWTPLLAAASQSPFLIIPCCSHDLSGARFRAPPAKPSSTSPDTKKVPIPSAYASLVSWTAGLATSLGYTVETEMLRIPSTRNTALLGRKWSSDGASSVEDVLRSSGGGDGWVERAMKLANCNARSH